MNSVLILYPEGFKCFSKFLRKVTNCLKNMDAAIIIYLEDPNSLIKRLVEEVSINMEAHKLKTYENKDFTHAIVFDDGEEFPREIQNIKESNKPLRLIRINITRVVNIKKDKEYNGRKSTPHYEYIGRGSYWGNPYVMHATGDDRDEVIRKFKYDFDNDKFATKKKTEVFKLAGKRLGCFCKPEACHGDVLANFLNEWDDGK